MAIVMLEFGAGPETLGDLPEKLQRARYDVQILALPETMGLVKKPSFWSRPRGLRTAIKALRSQEMAMDGAVQQLLNERDTHGQREVVVIGMGEQGTYHATRARDSHPEIRETICVDPKTTEPKRSHLKSALYHLFQRPWRIFAGTTTPIDETGLYPTGKGLDSRVKKPVALSAVGQYIREVISGRVSKIMRRLRQSDLPTTVILGSTVQDTGPTQDLADLVRGPKTRVFHVDGRHHLLVEAGQTRHQGLEAIGEALGLRGLG